MRQLRTGTTHRPTAEERFWALCEPTEELPVDRSDLGTCWRWKGSHDIEGRPRFSVAGRWSSAARKAWELAGMTEAPRYLRLEHFACDNSWCVNPAHVRPKTAVENVLGSSHLIAVWNARNPRCVMEHEFTRENTIEVPGGRACRICRSEVEALRGKATRQRHR